jgi:ribosomal protein S1
MKKAFAVILVVLFAFAITSVSLAVEEKKAPVEPITAEKPKVKQITGEVKAVDAKAMTITVTKKMKDKVIETIATITDKTKIVMGKEKKMLADVKVGDKVTLKYVEADGKNTAKSIAIKPVEPVEKKAEPAAPAEKKK